MNTATRGGYFAAENEAGTPSSPSTKKGFTNNTVRPLTLKTLVEAQVMSDGRLALMNGETSSALVYGCIRQIKESSNNYDIVIEDGTNSITVRQYFTGEKTPSDQLECGTWIRVTLTGKNVNQKIVYTSSKIATVRDFNEVLFHFAYCMHVHANGFKSNTEPPASKLSHVEAINSNDVSPGFAAMAGSLSPIQQAVLKIYSDNKSAEGTHIAIVSQRLSEKYPEQSVKQTVQWLLDEGYLYVTIDNDHAKSVME